MTYTLLLFLLSVFTISSLPHLQIPNAQDYYKSTLPITDFNSKKFGFVPINRSASGYYVNVDFHPIDSPEDSDTQDNRMMLALYTSNSVLTQGCENFSVYDCASYGCEVFVDAGLTSADYTHFTAGGYFTRANVYVDYENFNLIIKSVLANTCISHSNGSTYGSGTYGILGLGIGGSAWANYRSQRLLSSIYLDQNGDNGEWRFDFDPTKTLSTTAVTSLPATVNWLVQFVDMIQFGSSQIVPPFNTTILFDINFDVIGFPMVIYQEIIGNLTEKGNIKCPADSFIKPVCVNFGNLKNLPTISITTKGAVLNLPPDVYVENYDPNADPETVTLNIAAVDYNQTSTPGIFVTKTYAHSIILGSNVMKYYYTVFNATSYPKENYTIDLYISAPTQLDSDSGSSKVYIIVGSIVAFFIVSLFAFCIYRKCWKKQARPQNLTLQTTNNQAPNSDISEPLMQDIQSNGGTMTFSNSNHSSNFIDLAYQSKFQSREENRPLLKNMIKSDDPNKDSTGADILLEIDDKDQTF